MSNNIYELGKQIVDLKQKMFEIIKVDVEYILDNNIKDSNKIEMTLDRLLECCYNDESILYFKRLCKYYGSIDKKAELFYKKELKKYIE